MRNFGLNFTYARGSDSENFKDALNSQTRMVSLETPSNPLLQIIDISKAAKMAHDRNALLVVDNTFASPYLQEPLKLGADIAVHSTTKYLSGHSDLVDGAVVISDDALYEKVRFAQNAAGGVPGPLDCWLVLRGIKTFAVRMDRHCSNAQKVAEYLSTHPKIDKVLYPGLASHPQHLRAKEQMSAFGGMISFYLKGDFQACRSLLKHVKIFTLAESRISDRASEFDDACLSPEGTERKCRRKRFVSESLSWN